MGGPREKTGDGGKTGDGDGWEDGRWEMGGRCHCLKGQGEICYLLGHRPDLVKLP